MSQLEGRNRHRLTVAILTGGLTLVVLSGTSYLGTRCQCRYTPVLFAERAGLKQTVLASDVAPGDRRAFTTGVEGVGALVDPDWKLGLTSGPPVVYVDESHRRSVVAFAARWRQPGR